MSGAARLRKFRARRANGRAVWQIEGDVDAFERMLEAEDFLPACMDHSHAEVQAALSKFLNFLARADVQQALNKILESYVA